MINTSLGLYDNGENAPCGYSGASLGAGTDVAIDAADVVQMKSSLAEIPAAIRLRRATLKNSKENLF